MRKSYSPEIIQQVKELYILGYTVREIHEKIGVSQGYVSNTIDEFSNELSKNAINALHDFYRILKKSNLQPKDAFVGYSLFSQLSRNEIKTEQINSYVESVLVLAKQNQLLPEHLIQTCLQILSIQSKTKTKLEDLNEHYEDLVDKENDLENKHKKLKADCTKLQDEYNSILKIKKLTTEKIEKIDRTRVFLDKNGFDFSDYESLYDVLTTARKANYDCSVIVNYLNTDKNLDSQIHDKKSHAHDIESKITKLKQEFEHQSMKNENLHLKYQSMQKSIKIIEFLAKKGVSEAEIIAWRQILQDSGLAIDQILPELKKTANLCVVNSNLEHIRSKLEKQNAELEKKKSWLAEHVADLKLEISNHTKISKKNLDELSKHARLTLLKTIQKTQKSLEEFQQKNQASVDTSKKQYEEYFENLINTLEYLLERSHDAERTIGKMEAVKPLYDLINGKFEPVSSISQTVIILDKMHVELKRNNLDRHMICFEIKRLRDNLHNMIANV